MIIYCGNLALILFYGWFHYRFRHGLFLEKRLGNKRELILCIVIAAQLFLISALRFDTGADMDVYEVMFTEISNLRVKELFIHKLEPGFVLLNAIIAAITQNFQWVPAVSAFITFVSLGIAVYRHSKHIALSFLLYTSFIYYFTISGIRQGIALSLSLLAFDYLKKKEFQKYLFLTGISILFHYTAIIMLPLYFIANIKLNRKNMAFFTFVTLVFYLFVEKFYLLIVRMIPKYQGPEYISLYMKGQSWKSMIICVFIFLLMLIFRKKLVEKDQKNGIFFNISFLSVLISLFQTKINLLDRFPYFLNVYFIFSLPLLLDCFDMNFLKEAVSKLPSKTAFFLKSKLLPHLSNRILYHIALICIILFAVMYSFYVFSNNYFGILPYQTILTQYNGG